MCSYGLTRHTNFEEQLVTIELPAVPHGEHRLPPTGIWLRQVGTGPRITHGGVRIQPRGIRARQSGSNALCVLLLFLPAQARALSNVVHVAGSISPRDDIEIIDTELALADLDTIERVVERNKRMANAGDKDAQRLLSVLEKVEAGLNEGTAVRAGCKRCRQVAPREGKDYVVCDGDVILFRFNV